jgi:hypothetical protein
MNGTKFFGSVLAVLVMVFMFAPIASAQQYAGILDGQWFKVNLSVKGYKISDSDGETVLGKGAGSIPVYLYFDWTDLGSTSTYTITTCMENDMSGLGWYKRTSATIPIENVYGAVYPQVWELGGTYLEFYNGVDTFYAYPTFYTKITADKKNAASLKNASISNVVCTLSADIVSEDMYATGSCALNGPLIFAANVAKKVPAACLAP